jgi:hypothetical protein
MVKCTNCGHRWRAHQDRAPDEPRIAEPEDDLVVEAPPAPPEDDLVFETAPAERVSRAEPKPKRPPSKIPTILAASLAVVVVVGGAVVLLRQPIAGMVPGTAPLFSAIGLPVNTIGLVVEGVKSKPMLQAGRPVLSVTGAVRNVRDEAVAAPPIRVTLRDRAGVEVATLLAQVTNARVPPGAVRYFAITLPDPPAGATELEIGFELPGGGEPAQVATPVAPASEAVHAAEAQPLSPDSPHALEKHE